ncbi:acyl transferase domain-containing protein [Paenibacillus cellulosilyticus]|uniref:Acyl transferase domain-containing protein n=1 Tax=Paenibacillus cellulosilyticus TaxID=375489 RepID=A0A2V2YQQ4_9BACL|nr:beta-ketoacyl synthase N-terminal-like domain-containing protein [Paenibacillus cellulosilyticus]PWV99358.1 acyl transferase domain-containing protein [Paenibacillus cellulosilyticus]QKS45122.1 polyketide synthase dehydratase domain-containing protein [Paenibacillus cellulosilyticus]
MKFEPIAIVGQGCVFPGAANPDELWRIVAERRETLTEPEEDEWRLSREASRLGSDETEWSIRGGYIRGFKSASERVSLQVDAEQISTMDRMVHWMLHAAVEALPSPEAGPEVHKRTGAVIGNLSLPTESMSRYAEHVWLGAQQGELPEALLAREVGEPPAAINRFMSGYPAHFLAKALGLGAGAFCLDAACASSLYAIKLACDRLHDGSADLMLAGAVNGTDPLFLHTGFRALKAISRTGQSRPFHPEADGLVPSEGCGFVALKRLADAEEAGDNILGVIRGIGLSNDGGQGGMLAPAREGQVRAMRQAYEMSGLAPQHISLIECHATGTSLGDAVEIQSMSEVFAGLSGVPISSIKGNIGHPVTAAGMAGLIKVLRAMKEGIYPSTLHVDGSVNLLNGTPFRLPEPGEMWRADAPRRAALSSFGFGGNNAHLIVERYEPAAGSSTTSISGGEEAARMDAELAIVGIGVSAGSYRSTEEWAAALFGGSGEKTEVDACRAVEVELALRDISVPPVDLKQALPQQVMLLSKAVEAAGKVGGLTGDRVGVYVGMQCDAEIARHIARVRIGDWARKHQDLLEPQDAGAAAASLQHAFYGPLESSTVIGLLPNVPANRLNKHLKIAGPGFTVSSEELSGITALELASRALRSGELDAALVGAVDLSNEIVHQTAASTLLEKERQKAGDAAVVLAVKRLEDAQRDGNTVYAVLSAATAAADKSALVLGSTDKDALELASRFGHSHAASGLLHVAAGALALHYRLKPSGSYRKPRPWLRGDIARSVQVEIHGLGGAAAAVLLTEGEGGAPFALQQSRRTRLTLHTYAAPDRRTLLQSLRAGEQSTLGSCRLAIVARGAEELSAAREEAASELERLIRLPETEPFRSRPGIYYTERPVNGELAFVFTGAASAYAGMGSSLIAAIPELGDLIHERFTTAAEAAGWLYEERINQVPDPLSMLGGASFLTQIHAAYTQNWLGLRPQAVIGLSSGETNAIVATGAWDDLDGLFRDLQQHGIYSRELAGDYRVLKEAWGEPNPQWTNWRVKASPEVILEAIDADEPVRLTMINAPGDCIIGGEPTACRRVLDRLKPAPAYPLGYDMVVHCAEVAAIAPMWREIHRRETRPVPGIRYYSGVSASHYTPDTERVADALLDMGVGVIDFPRVIRQAWEDGARVFVEHGPRSLCSDWIGQILADREHLCIALDQPSVDSLEQSVTAAARLFTAGLDLDIDRLQARLVELESSGCTLNAATKGMTFPAHLPPVILPRIPTRKRDIAHPAAYPIGQEEVKPLNNMHETVPIPAAAVPVTNVIARNVRASAPAASLVGAYDQLAEAHRHYIGLQSNMQQQLMRMLTQRSPQPMQGTRAAAQPTPANAISQPAVETYVQHTTFEAAQERPAISTLQVAHPATVERISFTREQLEILAAGRISDVFGPAFIGQDQYAIQVRMPEPPLLLADRVVQLEGVPLSMGLGSIRTETDVRSDSWYLHKGRMPFGIMIESGQADLLLISWLGIDQLNRGERAYRLLGCELTFHGSLPAPGEMLSYDIRVDSHAKHGDIRLFFFRYDCTDNQGRRRMTMRQGQAGFFTREELHESAGVIWDPAKVEIPMNARLDQPAVRCVKSRFSPDDVRAFAAGDTYGCFGDGFAFAQTHTCSPSIQSGRMLLLDEVTAFETNGGPTGRGYLRAETALSGSEWFFAGHFKNDPAMPGTLMLEGCVQAMSFYLAGLGYTLRKDGWRFEPVPDLPYKMICRGQVTPESRSLVYEVFVQEVMEGPEPTLVADVLLTVDGRKAFHCSRLAIRLVPDFPLHTELRYLAEGAAGDPRAASSDGITFDYYSLLACAIGKPSHAFGSRYAIYDNGKHVPRLPGIPYHFMTRVAEIDGQLGVPKTGAVITAEYDIPPDAWYFAENGSPTMPFCVLLEAALQPCGWLVSYLGIPESPERDAYFRNLDGKATMHREVLPHDGTLRTRVSLTSLSRMGHTYIESFQVDCFLANEPDAPVFTMSTVFGHFTLEDLSKQVGLGAGAAEIERMQEPSDFLVDLRNNDKPFLSSSGSQRAKLAGGKLLMLDRVTGYWHQGGKHGLGRSRAEKKVDPSDWFFKAHFYQDPVQPGSLGVEAMVQLLQFHMLQAGMDLEMKQPRFESLGAGVEIVWKYRGQVTPQKDTIVVDLDVIETGRDERGVYAVAEASLWVDGLQIYYVPRMGMRLVDDRVNETEKRDAEQEIVVEESVFDPKEQPWVWDHCPTYTAPAMPSTFILDKMAAAVRSCDPSRSLVGASEVQFKRWLICDRPRQLRTEVRLLTDEEGREGSVWYAASLYAWREAADPRLSRFEEIASGRFELAHRYLASDEAHNRPFEPLNDPSSVDDPYESGRVFHGPAFQIACTIRLGTNGACALLAAEGNISSGITAPIGCLNPLMLDGATHAIPHDELTLWSRDITEGLVGYPHRITSCRFYESTPTTGEVRCEIRFDGFENSERYPAFRIRFYQDDRLWAELRLVEVLMPKGPIGSGDGRERRAFLQDRVYVEGMALSRREEGATKLTEAEVRGSDWFPGTIAAVYGVEASVSYKELTRLAAVKDHVAQLAGVHPSTVIVDQHLTTAYSSVYPYDRYPITIHESDGEIQAASQAVVRDIEGAMSYWRHKLGSEGWLGEDLYRALIGQFVGHFVVEDPARFYQASQGPVLYLANHQTAVESLLFACLAEGLTHSPVAAIAKKEHRDSWIGQLLAHMGANPDRPFTIPIVHVDREDQSSMLHTLQELAVRMRDGGESILVHVEGTRARSEHKEVAVVSGIWMDLAIKGGIPIVPVRFIGGLPGEESDARLEFPIGFGKQHYRIGRPIFPDELKALPLPARKQLILDALNGTGRMAAKDTDGTTQACGNPELAEAVQVLIDRNQVPYEQAVLLASLERLAARSEESEEVLQGLAAEKLHVKEDAAGRWLLAFADWLYGQEGTQAHEMKVRKQKHADNA